MTPTGTASIPLQNGQPIPPQAFEQLPPETKAELEQRSKQGQVEVGASMRQMRQIEKEAQERVTALDRGVALVAAGPLIAELHEEYGDQPDVLAFVEQIETDLPEHLHDFWPAAETGQAGQADGAAAARGPQRQERLARYQVNVLIDNSGMTGAPVVVERNPTYYNLIGRLDYRTVLGTMVTDFRQIKPGALHRANGGFLVLHALHVMPSPFAWEELKRALLSGEVRIENPGEQLSALSGLPLNQGIAATGAVNQHGEVQAVGGVTRKIEGFYDVCRERVLTGGQGVIVPTANVKNLMLKEEIVEAVRAGRFHVWAVSHIDQGIELLMERVAGERAADGTFPEGTVHRLVQDRLREYAEQLREFGNVSPGAALAAHARRNGNEDVPRERFRLRRRSACRGSR
jgi:predicted ATP-dependent protease